MTIFESAQSTAPDERAVGVFLFGRTRSGPRDVWPTRLRRSTRSGSRSRSSTWPVDFGRRSLTAWRSPASIPWNGGGWTIQGSMSPRGRTSPGSRLATESRECEYFASCETLFPEWATVPESDSDPLSKVFQTKGSVAQMSWARHWDRFSQRLHIMTDPRPRRLKCARLPMVSLFYSFSDS